MVLGIFPPLTGMAGQHLPAGVEEIHAQRLLTIRGEANHFRCSSPSQRWETRFSERGFIVAPHQGDWRWGLKLTGIQRASTSTLQPRALIEQNRLAYRWSDRVDEWYVNGQQGLEHGFTIAKPLDGSGLIELRLRVEGTLKPKVSTNGIDVSFGTTSGARVVNYEGLTAFDARGRTLPARFVLKGAELALQVRTAGARYPITIDPIAQQAYIKASNTDAGDNFGTAVSVSGDTVVVGAPFESSSATGINGNQANNSASAAGAAYVYVRTNGIWSQQAYLKPSNTNGGDWFGASVAISGNTIVVGAPREDSNATGINGNQASNAAIDAGAAYVFVRSGNTWTQQAYIKASNTDANDGFGSAVSISADTIIVGSPYEQSSSTGINGNQSNNSAHQAGAAYIFARNGTTWSQQAYVKASNTGQIDTFGYSVSVSGDTVVVGAPNEDSNATGINGNQFDSSAFGSGAVYVFLRTGSSWNQQAYVKASNTEQGDNFGYIVSVSGDTLAVGAPAEDSLSTGVNGSQGNGPYTEYGAAYLFSRTGSIWSQQAYIKASNSDPGDLFGWSISLSDDTLIVGARGEDSASTGINGGQGNTSSGNAGAAYVFERHLGMWAQQAYVKASNTGAQDSFGWSVGASGNTVAVGAVDEASNATGINGNQADNSAGSAGAVYVYNCAGPLGSPVSFWKVVSVGDAVPILSQFVTGLHPPVYSHNGLLSFALRTSGASTWAFWRNGNPWQPSGTGISYDARAAINGLGRVALANPAVTGGFARVDWTNWQLNAGNTGAPPPVDILSNFEKPSMPSQLPGTLAFLSSFGFNQGLVVVNPPGLVTPYFYGTRTIASGQILVAAIEDYDLSDTMHRGAFQAIGFGGTKLMFRSGAPNGTDTVFGVQGGLTGIGATTWLRFWSPAINTSGLTAYCAASNGAATQDEFICVNGQIVLREGDVVDGVSLSGFSPVALDLSNNDILVHVWQMGTRRLFFVGNAHVPEYSWLLLDTTKCMNLECSEEPLVDIKGRPTVDDALNIAIQATLSNNADSILRTTQVCLADTNGDCVVDIGDYSVLSSTYGSQAGTPGWDNSADFDFDGAISIGDFAILSSLYGMNCP